MMKQGHQLLSVAAIYGGALLVRKYGVTNEHLVWLAATIAALPIVAIPYITQICPLIPDGDTRSAITKNWLVAPGFWILRLFVSHRGFTHQIPGILAFGALLFFLAQFHLTLPVIVIFDLISVSILWSVTDNRLIRNFMAVLLVAFSPILTIESYYHAFLLGCFISYVSHMLGDAFTDEGWTLFQLGGFQMRFSLPIAFRSGGVIETHVIYPLLIVIIGYVFLSDLDFWKLKLLQEGKDLIVAYKHLI